MAAKAADPVFQRSRVVGKDVGRKVRKIVAGVDG
jgi:hypothetical protein